MQFITRTDIGDLRPWDTIDITLDDFGTVIERTFNYDDTSTREFTYRADGSLQSQTRTDTTVSSKDWESIRQEYRSEGGLSVLQIIYDDGVRDTKNYNRDGDLFLRQIVDTENAFDYLSRSLSFSDGELSSRTIRYDDGSVFQSNWFEVEIDGAMVDAVSTTRTDGPIDGGSKGWAKIEKLETVAGEELIKTVTYDSGLAITTSTTENNGLKSTLTEDLVPEVFGGETDMNEGLSDAFVWNRVYKVFDAEGNTQGNITEMDNEDVTISIFQEGQISHKLMYDGDNSNDWEVRLVFYEEDGSVDDVVELLDASALAFYDLTPFVQAFDFDSVFELLEYFQVELPPAL